MQNSDLLGESHMCLLPVKPLFPLALWKVHYMQYNLQLNMSESDADSFALLVL